MNGPTPIGAEASDGGLGALAACHWPMDGVAVLLLSLPSPNCHPTQVIRSGQSNDPARPPCGGLFIMPDRVSMAIP